jgi:hypothetical protein
MPKKMEDEDQDLLGTDDSPARDTVLARVSPGEVVLPRSVSKDPMAAARFVQGVLQGSNPPPVLPESNINQNSILLDAMARGQLTAKPQYVGPQFIEAPGPTGQLLKYDRRAVDPDVLNDFLKRYPATSGPQPEGYCGGGVIKGYASGGKIPATNDETLPPLDTSDFEGLPSISAALPSKQTLSDAGLGAVQGATLGLADEGEGALRAAVAVAQGQPIQSLPDLYRQYQQLAQARYAAAAQRSPNAYLAGEVGGGLATGLAIPGAGILGAGETALPVAARAGAAALAKNLGVRAAEGAGIGGIAGAGFSEGNLSTPQTQQQLAKDIATGAALGGSLGVAIPAATTGASNVSGNLAEAVENSPVLQTMAKGAHSSAENLADVAQDLYMLPKSEDNAMPPIAAAAVPVAPSYWQGGKIQNYADGGMVTEKGPKESSALDTSDFEPLNTSDFEPVEKEEKKPHSVVEALSKKINIAPGKLQEWLASMVPSKETLKDTAAGAVQGATLGLGDEAEGGIKAAGDVIGGKKVSDFPALYRQYQQIAQKRNEEAQKRSPNAYLTGELGGGLMTGLATAGTGLIGAGEAGLGAAAKEGAGTLAKNIAGRTVEGAGVGALAGAGTSKANVDTEEGKQKLLADTLGGATMGGALNVAVPAASEALTGAGKAVLNKASQYVQDSPLLRQAAKSFQMGKAGQVVSESDTAVNRMAREQTQDISEVVNKLDAVKQKMGSDIGNAIDQATDAGVKVQVQPGMAQAAADMAQAMQTNKLVFGTKESDEIINKLRQLGNGELTPKEAQTLKQQMYEMARGLDVPELKRTASRFYNSTNQALNDSVPGLSELNQKYSSFLSSGPEVLLSKGQPSELVHKFLSSMADPNAKIGEAVSDLLSTLSAPGVSKVASRRTYNELIDKLGQFDNDNPGMLKELGLGSPEEFGKDLMDKADRFAIQRQALGYEPHGSPASSFQRGTLGLANTGRGAVISGANLSGRAIGSVSKSMPARVSKQMYQASDETLYNASNVLENSGVPGIAALGSALRKGLETKNQSAKNAALFTILQDPRSRLLLSPEDIEE